MTVPARLRLLAMLAALLAAACNGEHVYQPHIPNADAGRGRAALAAYECGVCHVIPGVAGARGQVGPPLTSYARHVYVAGKFPNEPQMLVRWIVDPPALAPQTAMPALGVSEATARDMAAYLYTLQ